MRRTLIALLFLALAPAAHADGQDSLLSGYGGPGDGEQALLGQTLILKDSGGETTAVVAPRPSADELYAPAAPVEATPAVEGNTTAGRRPSKQKPEGTKPAPAVQPSPSAIQPVDTLDLPFVVEQTSAPSAFDSRDLALVLAILIMLGVLAACARRLAVRAARERRPSPA